ncbi:MAG: hypothetical protein JXQ73_03250 [Phycisphaerae bacterium]|nr:hypothetical protein [Phycisphaerae bacterium]
MSGTRTITVAAGQLQARPIERADDALDAIRRIIRGAGQFGVDLLVLPECAYPAYHLRSRAVYDALPLLGHEGLLQLLSAETRAAKLHLAIGVVEPRQGRLYNNAVLIGPSGNLIGAYSKQFLWDYDHDYFTPGSEIPVFETSIGRIGMLICADARAPEIVATLAAQQARLMAMPTNWVNAARRAGEFYNPQPDFLIPARCREFRLPFICANKAGDEDAVTRFCGMSRVVDADGDTVAETGPTGEVIVVAELETDPPPLPEIPGRCRKRLTSPQPPRRLQGTPTPTSVVVSHDADSAVPPADDAPCILVIPRNIDPAILSSLDDRVRPVRPTDPPSLQVVDGIPIGCVAGPEANGFAWPRALALDGALIICLFDVRADLEMLRTRAVENRVFVAALTDESAVLVGPDATVIARDPRQVTAKIDLSKAAQKTVAPRTDVFTERRPGTYRF